MSGRARTRVPLMCERVQPRFEFISGRITYENPQSQGRHLILLLIAGLSALFSMPALSVSALLAYLSYLPVWVIPASFVLSMLAASAVLLARTTPVPEKSTIGHGEIDVVALFGLRRRHVRLDVRDVRRVVLLDCFSEHHATLGGWGNHRVLIAYVETVSGRKYPILAGGPEVEERARQCAELLRAPLLDETSVVKLIRARDALTHTRLMSGEVRLTATVPLRSRTRTLVLAFTILLPYSLLLVMTRRLPPFFGLPPQVLKYLVDVLVSALALVALTFSGRKYAIRLALQGSLLKYFLEKSPYGVRGQGTVDLRHVREVNVIKSSVYWVEIVCENHIFYIPAATAEVAAAIKDTILSLSRSLIHRA